MAMIKPAGTTVFPVSFTSNGFVEYAHKPTDVAEREICRFSWLWHGVTPLTNAGAEYHNWIFQQSGENTRVGVHVVSDRESAFRSSHDDAQMSGPLSLYRIRRRDEHSERRSGSRALLRVKPVASLVLAYILLMLVSNFHGTRTDPYELIPKENQAFFLK